MNDTKKAIEYWKNFLREAIEMGLDEQINPTKLAISALEKQLSKKAEYHHKAGGGSALTICPNCESRLTVARYIFPIDRYCKECGQHYVVDVADWSVEE